MDVLYRCLKFSGCQLPIKEVCTTFAIKTEKDALPIARHQAVVFGSDEAVNIEIAIAKQDLKAFGEVLQVFTNCVEFVACYVNRVHQSSIAKFASECEAHGAFAEKELRDLATTQFGLVPENDERGVAVRKAQYTTVF